jgi:hypothetical protein
MFFTMKKMHSQQHYNYLVVKVGMKTMNNDNPKPKPKPKKYHSKHESTSDNLPVTIAKLEAYSKSQRKENQTKEEKPEQL